MIILFFVRRRAQKRETVEQSLELQPVIFDPTPVGEASSSPHLPFSATQSRAIIPNHPHPLSTSTSSPNIASSHDLIAWGPEIPANAPFNSNLHYSGSEAEVKPPAIILAPPPSSTVTTHQLARSAAQAPGNAPGTRLTNEQADFVNSLWRANVPAADIALVMERMRAEEAGHGESSWSGERGGSEMSPAPPSYDGTGI